MSEALHRRVTRLEQAAPPIATAPLNLDSLSPDDRLFVEDCAQRIAAHGGYDGLSLDELRRLYVITTPETSNACIH